MDFASPSEIGTSDRIIKDAELKEISLMPSTIETIDMAMFDWLEDRNKAHPTNLKQSLAEFNLLLGIYQSGLIRQPIDLPFDPPDNFIQHMKDIL